MKKHNRLKTVVIILLIIIISLISFISIYKKGTYKYFNIINNYKIGTNLEGSRVITLKQVDEEPSQELTTPEESILENVTTEEQTNQTENNVEDEKLKKETIIKNLKDSKKILEKRIKDYKVSQYDIRTNELTGDILIELSEEDKTDEVVSLLTSRGEFTVSDAQTSEVLIDKNDFIEAKLETVSRELSLGNTYYITLLNLEFNENGKQKLEQISNTYRNSTDEQGNEVKKEINLMIDNQTLTALDFDETNSTGVLQLTVGYTQNADEIKTYEENVKTILILLNSDVYPVEYETSNNLHIKDGFIQNINIYIIYIIIVILILFAIYIIIKYKLNGFLAIISIIGFIATLLLLIRYIDCIITKESLLSIIIIFILNYILINNILKNSKSDTQVNIVIKETLIDFVKVILPIFIIAIACIFSGMQSISSFGTIMFWGLILTIIYNLTITKILLIWNSK